MRNSPADLPAAQFRAIGHDLVDEIAAFLETLESRPVAPDKAPRELRSLIGGGQLPVPAHGADPAQIVAEATKLLVSNSTFNGHPRFFGYITSSASPIGALADLLAAAVNPNCGAAALAPLATEIELQTVRWIAELIGYSPKCGGLLVSGGNMANMVCLNAALRAQADWDVRSGGIAAGARLAVYASSEVHTWLQKGADLAGLGTDALHSIPVGASLSMDVAALERRIAEDRAAGWRPAVVVGTAGSVSTGAIDPLPEIAALCAREGLWFHVDGAYGAPTAVLDDAPTALRAIALADSVAVDPHKWLYVPLEAGCVLVRDREKLHAAFSFHPPYYRFDGSADDPPTNFHELGPQNSRGFRALKVWMTIRQVGREGYVKMIGEDIALARELYRMAGAHEDLEALTQALSITTFRYVPRDVRSRLAESSTEDYLNELNTALLAKLQREGQVYLSNAIVGTRFALRACIVNFRTSSEDIRALVEAADRSGRALDREMRGSTPLPAVR
ncbi:MAG TPA: aminotransferase class V-fold PLP-dependent enzyme [Gemmatimonadaceae bacterium]|nr:aminotransferase class V-fold PLP-dependent enzyme [Gemmatimonadaceae bacterium]